MTLSILVLGLVGLAINIYWRTVDSARRETAEAQIARVILDRIAADLRSVVPYEAQSIEDSDLPEGLTEDLLAILEGEELPIEVEESLDEEDELLDEMLDPLTSSTIPQEYGIYGDSDWIQIDMVRFPRGGTMDASGGVFASMDGSSESSIEETTVTASGYASGAAGLGAVKTVLYWHEFATTIDEDDLSEGTVSDDMYGLETDRHGLFRRELDRAVSLYAQEEGMVEEFDESLPPLAVEIDSIEFLYYDGASWLSEWDTEANEGLPVAVRVAVAVRKAKPTNPRASDWSTFNEEEEPPSVYSMIVMIPTAEASETATSDSLTDDSMLEEDPLANTQESATGGGML